MVLGQTRRRILLLLVVLAGTLNYLDRQIIAVLKPLLQQELHWTDADYGRLASLFQLAGAVAYLITGWLVDRLGARWATPLGVAAWSIAAMSHAWARSIGQFAAARVALGATESMGTPASIKTIAALFGARRRSVAFGVSNAAANIGAILSPLLLPALGLSVGWRGSFLLAGVAGLTCAVLWLAVTPGIRLPAPAQALSVRSYLRCLRVRDTWALAGAKALSDQAWWLMLFWAPDFFHRTFGVSLSDLGPPLAAVYTCAAAGALTFGQLSRALLRRGHGVDAVRKGVMLACAILATAAPWALRVHSPWAAVALLGLTLAAHQGFSVSVFSAIADVTPAARVGSVTAFGALCGNLAGMGVVLVAGEVLARGLGYLPLLLLVASSYALALAWLQLWLPRLEPAGDEGAQGADSPGDIAEL